MDLAFRGSVNPLFMSNHIGRKTWAIAEGYIPGWSNGPEPEFTSHEAFCILNSTDNEAHIELTIYYADREPVGPYQLTVSARRTKHFRFNNMKDPEPIPRAPATQVYFSPMCQWSFSTRDLTPVRPKMR